LGSVNPRRFIVLLTLNVVNRTTPPSSPEFVALTTIKNLRASW
jgi:hypothetical protein